jgi:hypothetical protein
MSDTSVANRLGSLRAHSGHRRTAGLDDSTLASFAATHPDLTAAVEAALCEYERIREDFAELLDQDEDAQVRAVQGTVTDSRKDLVGYDVEYRIGEQVASVRMDHNPGDSIPLKDGKLVLSAQ